MFKIGEFSKLTQVTIRMLRYYDEAGLLKPAKIDPWTGYRMYSVDQIPTLNKIVYLRDSGFKVSEIAAALGEGEREVAARLDRKYEEIAQGIRDEEDKLRRIELAKREIAEQRSQLYYNVTVKSVPGCPVLSLRRVIADYYGEGALWQELSAFAARNQISTSSETFSIYHDAEYKERDVDVELCAPVRELGESADGFTFRQTEAVPFMASTMVSGEFSNIAGAYQAFAEWLENSSYQMGQTSRQIVHRGPWNEEDPQKYLVEIQIPIEKMEP